jgi:uncharacterized membrane protein YuzA (DUF378 family)
LGLIALSLNLFASMLFAILGDKSMLASILYLTLFFATILAVLSVSYSSSYVAFKDIFLGDNH